MGQEQMTLINEGIRVVEKLENQINENMESFRTCTSGELEQAYFDGYLRMKEQLRELKNSLLRFQSIEKQKMLSGL